MTCGRIPPLLLILPLFLIFLIGSCSKETLERPEVGRYSPTTQRFPGGKGGSGPYTFTIDATSREKWVLFSFDEEGVVRLPLSSMKWDLGFKRNKIITNSGRTHEGGKGGALSPGKSFDEIVEAPQEGYEVDRTTPDGQSTENPLLSRWYRYHPASHLLTPRKGAFVIRTGRGNYAKMAIVSYYCQGTRPGCITFQYLYRGDGSRKLTKTP